MSDYKPNSFDPHTADKSYTGAGFFDAALSLNDAVKENDQVSIGLGSAGLALETIGLVLDPIGSLLTAGIGWLIEHVGPLRWPLDLLAGDPEGIAAAQEMLDDVKTKQLDPWVTKHEDALKEVLKGWSGEAADAFRKNMEAVTEQLKSLSGTMESAGTAMKVAGGFIGVTRGIIRDLISMLLASLIKGALIALALSWITFGGSIAAFIGQTIIEVAIFLSKVGTKLSKMASELGKSVKSLTGVGKATEDLGKAKVPGKTGGSGGGGAAPKPDPVPTGKPADTPEVKPPADTTKPPPTQTGPKTDETPEVKPPADTTKPPPTQAGPKPDETPEVKPPADSTTPSDATPPPGGGKPPETPPEVKPPADSTTPSDATPPPPGGKPPETPPEVKPPADTTTPSDATPPPPGGKPPETPPEVKPPADSTTPSDATPPPPGGKPTEPPPGKPADPPKTHGPKNTPYPDKLVEKFKDYFQQRVVANNPHISPQQLDVLMKKFDAAANMPVAQLGKYIGPENAEAFERAIKTMTDPWFGKRGLTGKTIVDLIKGMPTAITADSGGGDDGG